MEKNCLSDQTRQVLRQAGKGILTRAYARKKCSFRSKKSVMTKISATICLSPEMKSGPFLFSDDLGESCRQAAAAGFSGVDLIISSPDSVSSTVVERTLTIYKLTLGAIGTGAGFVCKGLSLTSPDRTLREEAIKYVIDTIDFAGRFGAAVIIGSMQGRIDKNTDRALAYSWLRESIGYLAEKADKLRVVMLFEPLNRYESNVINRLEDAIDILNLKDFSNVKLLADTFHMNIEEQKIGEAIRNAGKSIAYIHLADSNRCAAGFGHVDFQEVAQSLEMINYEGFLSAEVFPYPNAQCAAMKTIETFNRVFVKGPSHEDSSRKR
jgi:sugar phosphate isomerase/epimerase